MTGLPIPDTDNFYKRMKAIVRAPDTARCCR